MLDPAPGIPSLGLPSAHSFQAATDQTLLLVASESRRIEHHLLGLMAGPDQSLAELRAGPLGQDLARLAAVAAGQVIEPHEQVIAAIDTVLQLLYWPAGAEDYSVPRAFWATDLGRMLARAKFRAFPAQALVGIGDAAEHLGVSRPTIYRWMEARSLDFVHDEISGRSYVLRHGIDQRLQATASLQA
jgi:excisionase family DNA binding protein